MFQKKEPGLAGKGGQLRDGGAHPFGALDRYIPLQNGEIALYRAVREAVPIVDAAILKLIRLSGGVGARCADPAAQKGLDRFLRTVPTGRGQRGLQSFLDCYLDSMLTCGRGVGELVLDRQGREIAALLCGNVEALEIREGESPLDFRLCARRPGGAVEELPYPELLLFTPFQPEADRPDGTSLLRSMPILTAERCREIAREWSAAMQEGRRGQVRDFVAVGDVDIRAIGADNQVLDSQVPVRQILEQLIARTGIPPFMLGLSWSSTERMSTQQADMLTSEIAALRRSLEPVVERICELWLRIHGFGGGAVVEWEDISLQDQVEEARAALYREQARALRRQNEDGRGGSRAGDQESGGAGRRRDG